MTTDLDLRPVQRLLLGVSEGSKAGAYDDDLDDEPSIGEASAVKRKRRSRDRSNKMATKHRLYRAIGSW